MHGPAGCNCLAKRAVPTPPGHPQPQMGALGDLGYDHQALLDTLCDEVRCLTLSCCGLGLIAELLVVSEDVERSWLPGQAACHLRSPARVPAGGVVAHLLIKHLLMIHLLNCTGVQVIPARLPEFSLDHLTDLVEDLNKLG